MIARLAKKLARRKEAKHAGWATGGTVVAQLALIGLLPVLSRLYSPEDYAVLGLQMTVSTIGGSAAALCFNTAILLPKERLHAVTLYHLSVMVGVVGSLISAILGIAVYLHGLGQQTPGYLLFQLVLLYLAIFYTLQFNSVGTVQSREGQYKHIALSKIFNTVLPAVLQIGLAFTPMSGVGLEVGRVIGLIATVWLMAAVIPKAYAPWRAFKPLRLKRLRTMAVRYRDSIYHVPRVLLLRGASNLPAVLLLAQFGPLATGLYFFADRIIQRPGLLLGDTLQRIPLKSFAERKHEGKPLARFAAIYTALCVGLVVPGVAVLVVAGPWIFETFFGPEWRGAADYASALGVMTCARLAAIPMSSLSAVLRSHRASLVIDIIFFGRIAAFPIAAALGRSAIEATWWFAGISVIYNVFLITVSMRYAFAYDKTLAAAKEG